MSHSLGAIRFKDGTIRFYEYNGTSDYPISHHYETEEEVFANWRNHKWMDCSCGQSEEIMAFSSYGDGFYFKGKACKNCLSVESDAGWDVDIIERNETEDWAPQLPNFQDW